MIRQAQHDATAEVEPWTVCASLESKLICVMYLVSENELQFTSFN